MKNNNDPFVLQYAECMKRVEDDELNAVAILKDRDGTPAHVCFTCQQMAEKCFKAFLVVSVHDYPKVHSLDKLLEICAKEDVSFFDLKDEAILLNEYYMEARYPDNMPLESFTWEMAEEAYAAAEKIKKFVLKSYITT